MRVSLSWLRDHVDLPAELGADALDAALVRVGLEVEEIADLRASVTGPLVVGRVLSIEDVTGAKKPIRYCQVDAGEAGGPPAGAAERSSRSSGPIGMIAPRGIICGATNFVAGDAVVVALPGAVLPGGFEITARTTYGHVSDGMICSARELALGDDHSGIIVLPSDVDGRPGDDARPLVGLDDIVVELAITPDRGYCFAVRGIARELSHSLGVPFRDPGLARTPGPTASPAYPVRVEDTVGCDRFAGRVVCGIDPTAPSPAWLRQRLAVAGVRSISLAVDISNYVMLDLGQPMHAFDLGALRGELVVRRAMPGERLTTLDGTERVLDVEDLIIADDSGVISLAAIMGGATTEVSASTVDVLFEAAHWDPVTVARAARRHRLPSEASKRFERGVDPAIGTVALERAVALLTEYAGGTVDERVLDINHVAPRDAITIEADLPGRTAGVAYPPERVVEILTEIGCAVTPKRDRLTVTPPTWRPDLTDPADLVEEVIRLDGYDRVPVELPRAPAGRGLTDQQRRRRSVGRALAENGYVEVLCYPFVGTSTLDALGMPADDPRRRSVRLRNPLSEEEPALRTTLLPPLLTTLRRNLGRGLRDLALYEIGLVFHPVDRAGPVPELPVDRRPSDVDIEAALKTVPHQPWHVAAVLAGEVEPTGWWGDGRPAGWSDAVQAARIVAEAAGVTASGARAAVTVRAGNRAPWHPGRCAEILADGAVVGYAGELDPAVCAALDLPRRTCAMELTLDALSLPGATLAPQISTFPPALIDVALVVGVQTPAAQVEQALADGAGELLESVRLFDVYAGEQLGAGHKSLAYKLTFRAPDRTLTVEEAVAARDAAVAVAAERVGATLRGD